MKEDKRIGYIGSGILPYVLISSLLATTANRDSQLTADQKAERDEKRRLIREERVRQAKVIKNICPDCDGKLIRGKKDKKNGYKRLWTCKDCGNSHSS